MLSVHFFAGTVFGISAVYKNKKHKYFFMAASTKPFGVWIDGTRAMIVGRANVDTGAFVSLGSETNVTDGVFSNEHTKNNSVETEKKKFFKAITANMQNATDVLITGPGKMQEEFAAYLADTPQFKNTRTIVEASQEMSEGGLIEVARDRFGA